MQVRRLISEILAFLVFFALLGVYVYFQHLQVDTPEITSINPEVGNPGDILEIQGLRFGDKKIYNCEFTVEEVRKLIGAAFDVFGNEVTLSADNDHGLYSNSKEELPDKFWQYNDFKDFNEPCMKFCIETLDKEKIEKVASSIGIDKIDYLPFSDIPWYKLSKKGATKEKAIEELCSHLKITPDQIAAFGDDFSDIGMLKLCGKGVAMENAIAEVKQIADEVCKSNEADGVAKWIEKFCIAITDKY